MSSQVPSTSPNPSTPPSSPGSETPPPGATPTLSSSVASMWTGLIRRFSSETTIYPSESSSSDPYSRASAPKDGINGVYAPSRPLPRTASPFRPPPLDPVILRGYRATTVGTAKLLTLAVAEEIRIMIPERLKLAELWRLVYSLDQDGASLGTLYQKAREYEGKRAGFVLVVRDSEGGTFGAYLSEYPRPASSYFGNGECFLWRASVLASLPPPPSEDTTHLTRSATIASPTKTSFSDLPSSTDPATISRNNAPDIPESIRFKAFPYSGMNDYYINCETRFLSVGAGGGHYGLWLDDSLDRGHSSTCETFGNEPLSDEGEKFSVFGVELWVLGA